MKKIILIGAGGHAKSCIDVIELEKKYKVIGMIDNIKKKKYMNRNKVTIIAEIGVNHNGSFLLAKKLINLAKNSGADFVKFQSFKAENLVKDDTKTTRYQQINTKKKRDTI